MIEFNINCEVSGNATLCDLKYDESQPAEIKMCFHFPDEDIEWIISRQLLKDVLESGSSGEGECLFYLEEDKIKAVFISPEGKGIAYFDKAMIKYFVEEMYNLVPSGSDVYDMSDETLQNWLDSFA